jgi:hypothetical protein
MANLGDIYSPKNPWYKMAAPFNLSPSGYIWPPKITLTATTYPIPHVPNWGPVIPQILKDVHRWKIKPIIQVPKSRSRLLDFVIWTPRESYLLPPPPKDKVSNKIHILMSEVTVIDGWFLGNDAKTWEFVHRLDPHSRTNKTHAYPTLPYPSSPLDYVTQVRDLG